MSGKPSYAAVAAKPPTGENQAGGSSQGEAPPPCESGTHPDPLSSSGPWAQV